MPDRDSYAPGTPSWVDIGSTDLDKTHAFYTGLFGWQRQDAGPPEQTGGYGFYMQRDRMVAGYGPSQTEGVWWSLYIDVVDADATAGLVAANGGAEVVGPMDVMAAGRMAIFTDPQGAVFSVWQAGEHHGCQIANEPGAFSWNELLTTDIKAASAFYEPVLGWGQKNGPDADYYEWTVGGEVVCGGMNKPPQMPAEVPPHWNIYFGSADVDAAVTQVDKLGGVVLAPPFDVPDVGRMATVAGPLGETFSLFQY